MKYKAILLTAVIALLVLVVGIALLSVRAFEPYKDIKDRIRQYKLVLEEQELITKILTLKYEAAVIQAKFKPVEPPTPAPPMNAVIPAPPK